MAGPAIRERINFVVLHQFLADFHLVWGRLIGNAENLIPRPHVIFRMPMAIQAPVHLHRVLRPRERHGADGTMTRGATDPFSHVDAVIEIHELG